MNKIRVNETYYFINVEWPTALPYEVKVVAITGRIVFFDKYISGEKFAEIEAVSESLFDSKIEATKTLCNIVSNGDDHFIDEKDIKLILEENPEYFL